jgi:hypothetical protein
MAGPLYNLFISSRSINKHGRHRPFLFAQAVSKEKISRNRPIRYKNYLWLPCLYLDQDEMSNLNRGPSISTSYQVSVHLAKQFQRKRFKPTEPLVFKMAFTKMFQFGEKFPILCTRDPF